MIPDPRPCSDSFHVGNTHSRSDSCVIGQGSSFLFWCWLCWTGSRSVSAAAGRLLSGYDGYHAYELKGRVSCQDAPFFVFGILSHMGIVVNKKCAMHTYRV